MVCLYRQAWSTELLAACSNVALSRSVHDWRSTLVRSDVWCSGTWNSFGECRFQEVLSLQLAGHVLYLELLLHDYRNVFGRLLRRDAFCLVEK